MPALTSENVRAELKKVEADASVAFADAEKMKADMVEEGVNPLTDADAFDKVDEAYKAYSIKAEEAETLKGRLNRLAEIDGVGQPSAATPLQSPWGREPQAFVRPGERFVQSEEYQAFHKSGAFSSEAAFSSAMSRGLERPVEIMSRDELENYLRMGAVTVTGGGATSAGPFIQADLIPGFVAYIRKTPVVAALVGQGVTDSDIVEYVTQSAPTNAAAETAEDTAAPESTLPYATNTTNVREITHFVPVTLRAMSDHGQIRTIVEEEIGVGVIDRLDTQLYSGDGAGQNLTGIVNAAGINTRALGADSRADAVHKAMTQIRVAAGVLDEPDAVIMHPNDWEQVRLEKDANGNYLLGPAAFAGVKQIWGMPVVVSTVATENTALVGAFARSARMWLREALAVTTGLSGTDFTQRRVSILGALRLAFAVPRPGGFTTITGF
ncbi:hypothetical protein LCGC14_1212420 [marine sediment metagenome]|uniref:Phage capsid-like C-terminal domain-containing protein n=1 Tax=marine sediment metagenome TaxID=412755 RepID=A0A0F9LI03_9ZZZZ